MAETRAVQLAKLGILGAKHPLFDIVHYMSNDFMVDDLRSALTFEATADAPFLKKALQGRKLNILYPASGSHLTPLVIPMKLIDANQIDEAKLVYYEINSSSAVHLSEYLEWLEERGLIDSLFVERRRDNQGEDIAFRFKYRGKKVELDLFLNRGSEDLWTTTSALDEADMVIFHDGADSERRKNIIDYLEKYKNKPKLIQISSKNYTDLSDTQKGYSYQSFSGAYGCGPNSSHRAMIAYRVVEGRVIRDDRTRFMDYPFYLGPEHNVDEEGLFQGSKLVEIK